MTDMEKVVNGQPVKPKINKAGQVCCGKSNVLVLRKRCSKHSNNKYARKTTEKSVAVC